MSANAWQPDQPYNSLPVLPPAQELESKAILRQCIRSRAALAELKQAAEHLPNQGMLINTLPLLEARASSEIENIVTTTDRLFRFRSLEGQADPATREALRYGAALLEGFRSLRDRPLCTGTAEEVCSRIKGLEMRVRKVPGTALASDRTGAVIYTPPEGEDRLRQALHPPEADECVDPRDQRIRALSKRRPMKLQFKHQDYQVAAVDAVVDCFTGQPVSRGLAYTIDPGRRGTGAQGEMGLEETGFANARLELGEAEILENLRRVQRRQNLAMSEALAKTASSDLNLDHPQQGGQRDWLHHLCHGALQPLHLVRGKLLEPQVRPKILRATG